MGACSAGGGGGDHGQRAARGGRRAGAGAPRRGHAVGGGQARQPGRGVAMATWCGSAARSLQGRGNQIRKKVPGISEIITERSLAITTKPFSYLKSRTAAVFELFEAFKLIQKL